MNDSPPEITEKPKPRSGDQRWRTMSINSAGEDEGEHSWVLAYIDLLTILLTLFIMLLVYARFDGERLEMVTQALANTKAGSQQESPFQIDRELDDIAPQTDKPGEQSPDLQKKLNALADKLQQDIAKTGLLDNADIGIEKGRVTLQLGEKILFASGEAELTDGGHRVLRQVLPTLQSVDYEISIEGHTDNLPIINEFYASNWELSATRATFVVRDLIDLGINAQRLRAIAYADVKPVATNRDVAGRARNRRVSIVIHAVNRE